jgi:hypothetical protein
MINSISPFFIFEASLQSQFIFGFNKVATGQLQRRTFSLQPFNIIISISPINKISIDKFVVCQWF